MNIGILDTKFENPNPLTGKQYSDAYKKIFEKITQLPIYKRAHEIIKDIQEHQVILLESATGSGKSVYMPKFVLHTYDYNGKIAMTLPKQIITKSAAEFGALSLDVKLGEEVGYQYKGASVKSDKTKLLYATDGTIVQRLLNDLYLKDFDCVIIDEAHERKPQIDFLLYLLRETIKLRPEFKLVIMSATVNAEIFENYFKGFSYKRINVEGERLYPIESIFMDKMLNYKDLLDAMFEKLVWILEHDDPLTENAHDVIIFVTSSNEANEMCKKLSAHLEKDKGPNCKITCTGDIFCVEVYSGMNEEKEKLAKDKDLYKSIGNYNRRVVIGTNVMESSLTIDGIKYVIDSGYELKSSYDPENRARKLDRQLTTRSQCMQRMGRSGRVEPGICYHMYTQDTFDHTMKKYPDPDIRVSDITEECLKLISIDQISTTEKLLQTLTNFIEPPHEIYIRTALNNLMQLGAIEQDKVTKLGLLLNQIPGHNIMVNLSIVMGMIYKCSREVIKILSFVDAIKNNLHELYNSPVSIIKKTDDPNYKKRVDALEKKFNEARNKIGHKYGDHLSLLNIYEKYEKMDSNKVEQWCYDNFIKQKSIQKAKLNAKKILYQLPKNISAQELGFKYDENIANLKIELRVLACLLMGFRLNTGSNKGGEFYRTQFSNLDKIKINKISFLTLKNKLPKNIFYHEFFISMGKNDLNIVSEIPKKIIKILS